MKNILLTHGENEINRKLAAHFLANGENVVLFFSTEYDKKKYLLETNLSSSGKRLKAVVIKMTDFDKVSAMIDDLELEYKQLDVLIHGDEMLNEEEILKSSQQSYADVIQQAFQEIFILNKCVLAKMMKKKKGCVIFPIIYDALYYAGYPSSPTLNHGKISLMKSLSREITAFRLRANVITMGYYNSLLDRNEIKKSLEIYGLRPQINDIESYFPAISLILEDEAKVISGQDIHLGIGIETTL